MKLPWLLCIGFLGSFLLYSIYQWSQSITVQVIYDDTIDGLPISVLKNLRNLNNDERKRLFIDVGFAKRFDIAPICTQIKKIQNPNILLWFTNHFGYVSQQGLNWYRTNIFEPLACTHAMFWLVDLAAWRFLSLKADKLLVCQDFIDFCEEKKRGVSLGFQECPLIRDRSIVLEQLAKSKSKRFNILHANDFFMWMHQLLYSCAMVDKTIPDQLIKEGLRPGSAQFSLREIGYYPCFLDYSVKKMGKNILDCDNTQVFAFLQYIEGIYYTLKIIDHCITKGEKECNIVFLLPNKEFTYYLVPGELLFFDTFRRHIEWFANQHMLRKNLKITIYFYPFAYGNTFYEQPYTQMGPVIDTIQAYLP